MQCSSRKLLCAGAILFLVCWFPPLAVPQAAAVSPSQTASLQQLTRNSGYIFGGTVISIEHLTAIGPNIVPTVRVTFRVEDAIRGVRIGQTLVIREWAGLWESGGRYRRGERVLLFLYPSSKLGLTSSVGGMLGRFPMNRSGQILLEQTRITSLRLNPAREILWRGKSRISSHEFADAIRYSDIRNNNEE
jgi:hypothetical protein